jgi:glycerol-3-phosphate dehydrogenase
VLRDQVTGQLLYARARVVINATGAWADRLRVKAGTSPRIRPLRGSHLIFPGWRLPVAQAIALWHPLDGRPVFVFPWEGITLIGTTDVDHFQSLDEEPSISPEEAAYLMAAVEALFPSLNLTLSDAIASYSGVRPVIGSGKVDPSKESREHVIWNENGLLTVTGGKLTTFRLIAHQVLQEIAHRLPESPQPDTTMYVLEQIGTEVLEGVRTADGMDPFLDDNVKRRLVGRYGADAPKLVAAANKIEFTPVKGTQVLWAELSWAARSEGVVHLDDLLLRRVRLGLLLPEGGKAEMAAIRSICQEELGWDNIRWQAEEEAYFKLWKERYRPPDKLVPDWKLMLADARKPKPKEKTLRRRRRKTLAAGALVGLAIIMAAIHWLRRPSQHIA